MKRAIELERREVEQEKLRRRQFPISPGDYHTKDDEMKSLVARFLLANSQDKERALDRNNWAWAQVEPLMDAFKSDVGSLSARTLSLLTLHIPYL